MGPVRSLAGADSVVLVPSIPAATVWASSQTQPVSVVCYLSMWLPQVSLDDLRSLRGAVPEDSRLFFVEPTASVGLAHRIQRWGRVILTKRLGLAFHRDIPVLLRASGWEPTSVLRFSVGYPASVLTFVAGEARAY
ncbi:MAG: hypothetical protein HKN03_16835 [Acidimicrobiales bacterium]|nr:hypothetical protein [Acidimicrobiales bacterium]